MQMQKAKTAVSLVVIVACAAYLAIRYFGPPPKIDARPHIGIGNALADQAAKALGGGGRIFLIAPDVSVFSHPGAEVQLKAFHSALRKANLSVAATNWIKLDPDRPLRVPPGDFVELLRKRSEADVVVSLLGPPLPTAEQKAKLPAKRARIIAVVSEDLIRQVNLQSIFDENLLYAAIVNRPVPTVPAPQTDNPQAWFDHLYTIATARNLTDLPAPLRAANP
jgi:hypothetical protein